MLLLGPSGSGKSTVLAGLAGLLENEGGDPRDEGMLRIDAHLAGDPALRGRVGLVLQDPAAQTILARCGDDVAFGCENLGVPAEEIWHRVDHALNAVGLAAQGITRERPTEFLSGGQRQRLALAGVVAMRPGLLLLDEPTANLDPDGVLEVRDAVRQVLEQTGATLIVVEHRVETWLDVVERVIVLDPGGGVSADGDPASVLREHGAVLADQGVWVPGHPPQFPTRARTAARHLLRADELAVAPPGATSAVASGLNLTVEAGRCLALTGPNGAGKSTTALTLAGLLKPVDGAVNVAESLQHGVKRRPGRRFRATSGPWSWRSSDLLTRIGMVFQDPEHQFLARTVREELRHGPLRAGLTEAEASARADDLLERLRLTRLAEANPFTLSGGEKRRLSVATALATRPYVLILDEPTFGQDRTTFAETVALIAGLLDQGLGVLAVTHDQLFVDALADQKYEFGR